MLVLRSASSNVLFVCCCMRVVIHVTLSTCQLVMSAMTRNVVELEENLQNLILVQFLKKYGEDFVKVFEGLRAHPLLKQISLHSAEDCRLKYSELLKQEGLSKKMTDPADPRAHQSKNLLALSHILLNVRTAEIKLAIVEEEEKYFALLDEVKEMEKQGPKGYLHIEKGATSETIQTISKMDADVLPTISEPPSPNRSKAIASVEFQCDQTMPMSMDIDNTLEDRPSIDLNEIGKTQQDSSELAKTDFLDGENLAELPEGVVQSPSRDGTRVEDAAEKLRRAPGMISADRNGLTHITLKSRRGRSNNQVLNTEDTTDETVSRLAEAPMPRGPGRPGRRKKFPTVESTKEEHGNATTPPTTLVEGPDSPALLKKFQSNIIAVLNNISAHRFASIFATPVSSRDAPNYGTMIRKPMDIKTIKARIKNGDILTSSVFHKEILQMLSNAIMFNSEGSEVGKMAWEVGSHAEHLISMYKDTELVVQKEFEEDDRKSKRRKR